jgi:hypothetical protein
VRFSINDFKYTTDEARLVRIAQDLAENSKNNNKCGSGARVKLSLKLDLTEIADLTSLYIPIALFKCSSDDGKGYGDRHVQTEITNI